MSSKSPYDHQFFHGRAQRVQSSAETMVQLMNQLFQPSSVVDVGCGDGAWLAEWAKLGISRIRGIDGDWVDQSILKIPVANFVSQDLNRPFTLNERFDLCTSFEVAEHLSPQNASTFVRSLTSLSDLIVFSAAVPGQGGTGHLNEQWQEYWMDQFTACGYVAYDAIAPHVWLSHEVQPCYLQNTLLYIKADSLSQYKSIVSQAPADRLNCGKRIHPRMWTEKVAEGEDLTRFGMTALLKAIPKALRSSISSRMSK